VAFKLVIHLNLAIFDLDNTLIGGDSDHSWGEFLVEQGLVDGIAFKQANDQFYQDYLNGSLDIHAYVAFALAPLQTMSDRQIEALQAEFMRSKIASIMLPKAQALIEKHKSQGDTLLIITATNHFITAPIAKALGIEHLLATDPERVDGKYTGKIVGTPCFQGGKVIRLKAWLETQTQGYQEQYFYSDSINDLPLLEQVDYPVAVDADEKLAKEAQSRGWPHISLR